MTSIVHGNHIESTHSCPVPSSNTSILRTTMINLVIHFTSFCSITLGVPVITTPTCTSGSTTSISHFPPSLPHPYSMYQIVNLKYYILTLVKSLIGTFFSLCLVQVVSKRHIMRQDSTMICMFVK